MDEQKFNISVENTLRNTIFEYHVGKLALMEAGGNMQKITEINDHINDRLDIYPTGRPRKEISLEAAHHIARLGFTEVQAT